MFVWSPCCKSIFCPRREFCGAGLGVLTIAICRFSWSHCQYAFLFIYLKCPPCSRRDWPVTPYLLRMNCYEKDECPAFCSGIERLYTNYCAGVNNNLLPVHFRNAIMVMDMRQSKHKSLLKSAHKTVQ